MLELVPISLFLSVGILLKHPPQRILVDVFPGSPEIGFVINNVIIKSGLPGKIFNISSKNSTGVGSLNCPMSLPRLVDFGSPT